MQVPDTAGAAMSQQQPGVSQCLEKKRWHSLLFPTALSPSSLMFFPQHHPAHRPPPSFHPPQFLVWLCHILKMHAARRLSLCPGWRLWLVGGSSPGAKLWVFTLRRCCLYGLSLVTLGLSSTEMGLILLRFRPLLLFPLTLKTPTHRVVFTRELVLCY